jgi:hypothetical protein
LEPISFAINNIPASFHGLRGWPFVFNNIPERFQPPTHVPPKRGYASPRELAILAAYGNEKLALNGNLGKMLGRVEKR